MFIYRLADFFFLFAGDTKKIVAKSKSESKIVTKNEGTFFSISFALMLEISLF